MILLLALVAQDAFRSQEPREFTSSMQHVEVEFSEKLDG